MPDFDDARLDDWAVLARHDGDLRELALTGAHIRTEAAVAAERFLDQDFRPRGIVLAGHESRLIRTVAEPTCSAPLIAWPHEGLPGWAGPLDMVVVQASGGPPGTLASTVAEACRRGCAVIVAASPGSEAAASAGSRHATLLEMGTDDAVAAAVALIGLLASGGFAPSVHIESVAEAADMVAEQCSPHKDLSLNPAKGAAIALADALPLVWGGSQLAARAARRIAEELRRVTGRAALATPAGDIVPILTATAPHDPFADLGDEPSRPVLVTLDDGGDDRLAAHARGLLCDIATTQQVRVVELECTDDAGALGRHISLLQQGLYMAAYLGVGYDGLSQGRGYGID